MIANEATVLQSPNDLDLSNYMSRTSFNDKQKLNLFI